MSVERTGFEILMSADASGVVKGSKEGAEALGTVATKTKDLNDALDAGKPIMGCALDDWCLLSMQVTDPIGRDLLGCNS